MQDKERKRKAEKLRQSQEDVEIEKRIQKDLKQIQEREE